MTNHDNFEINFSLKGNASIQIGIYILLAAYIFKYVLDSFLVDDNPVGMLSVEILEFIVVGVAFLAFLLSGFALYFKGKRKAKKFDYKLWNGKTKKNFWLLLLSLIGIFAILFTLTSLGYINFITPTFLLLYGLLIFLNKNKSRKNLLIITGVCMLFAVLCMLIPSYWYYSLFILGIAHITYGFSVR